MAQEQDKEVKGLESVAEQMDIFERISYEEQAKDLMEMVNENEDLRELFSSMITMYKDEEIEKLYETTEAWMDSEEELEIMLLERNRNWIDKIGEFSSEYNVFYAVGAGHLGGKEGVIQLLIDKGYKVSPIISGS